MRHSAGACTARVCRTRKREGERGREGEGEKEKEGEREKERGRRREGESEKEREKKRERRRERRNERARLRRNLCAVLFLFSLRHSHSSMDVRCGHSQVLWKRCECRGCYGTDDWKEHADEFSLRTAFEGVSCRLEVQRQVDEISAVQCRKNALAETNFSSKSASCKEAVARLQSSKGCSGDTCWCPQCPGYVVGKALAQGHVVAHCDENARAER